MISVCFNLRFALFVTSALVFCSAAQAACSLNTIQVMTLKKYSKVVIEFSAEAKFSHTFSEGEAPALMVKVPNCGFTAAAQLDLTKIKDPRILSATLQEASGAVVATFKLKDILSYKARKFTFPALLNPFKLVYYLDTSDVFEQIEQAYGGMGAGAGREAIGQQEKAKRKTAAHKTEAQLPSWQRSWWSKNNGGDATGAASVVRAKSQGGGSGGKVARPAGASPASTFPLRCPVSLDLGPEPCAALPWDEGIRTRYARTKQSAGALTAGADFRGLFPGSDLSSDSAGGLSIPVNDDTVRLLVPMIDAEPLDAKTTEYLTTLFYSFLQRQALLVPYNLLNVLLQRSKTSLATGSSIEDQGKLLASLGSLTGIVTRVAVVGENWRVDVDLVGIPGWRSTKSFSYLVYPAVEELVVALDGISTEVLRYIAPAEGNAKPRSKTDTAGKLLKIRAESDVAAYSIINGRYAGITPLQYFLEKDKALELRLLQDGYADAEVKLGFVDLKTELRVPLLRDKIGMDISSKPSDAAVFLNESAVGFTPITGFSIAPGIHSLTVSKPGYRRVTKKLTVERDSPSMSVQISLERE